VASEYCPLDLFSGDETRIIKAIHALWDRWISSDATANNLKIFARGNFLKPSKVSFFFPRFSYRYFCQLSGSFDACG
jgi:inositol-pentakisphosphate 2-kinase